jgi:ElaB/YqjD/DUF883 family membrane-anchored ribosome-binding protein
MSKEFNPAEANHLPKSYDNGLSEGEPAALAKVKNTITDKLHNAADALRQQSQGYADKNPQLADYGNQAAVWLNRSANYIDEINPQQVKSDVVNQVRHNPGRSLLIAAGVGLVLGALLRRR